VESKKIIAENISAKNGRQKLKVKKRIYGCNCNKEKRQNVNV